MLEPINPNNSLNAEHVIYCASSGGGKTSAVKKLGLLKATDQIVFLDPYGDYEGEFLGRKVRTYTKWADFYNALREARKSSRGFKIAMKPPKATPEALEKFSQIVWACGNGKHPKPLKAVFEELAKMVKTSAKADGYFGEILTGGRKFAIHAHCCFQRGQEIPKTVFGQAPFKWIGLQERQKDADGGCFRGGCDTHVDRAQDADDDQQRQDEGFQRGNTLFPGGRGVVVRTRGDGRVECGSQNDIADIERGEQQARNHAGDEHLADGSLCGHGIDDGDHRGRDQDAERPAGADRSDRELRTIFALEHGGQSQHAHGGNRGTDDARHGGDDRADGDGAHR